MKRKLFSLLFAFLLLPGLTALAAEGGDPLLSRQTNLSQIDYFPVLEQGFNGAGVTVALIDSGVYTWHEEFRSGSVLPVINMLRSSRFDPTEDSSGHGTFIAGMLAAARDNGVGIAGMVDGVSILPFKCFSGAGETDLRYVVRAIYSAVDDYGCDVINVSLGMDEDTAALRLAVDHAVENGVIVISAVGNDGTATLNYPAAYDSVVGVGSVDAANKVSAFSQRNGSVFVVAPGEALISTGVQNARSYVEWGGTSFACVHATALAAVAKQYDRSIDAARFMSLLRQSAVDLGPEGYDEGYGWGLVSAAAFLDALYAENAEPAEPAPEPEPKPAPEPELEPEPARGWVPNEPEPARGAGAGFTDVDGHWAKGEIITAVERGIFTGITDTEFWPDYSLSRAMAATLLYRLAGSPAPADPAFEYADVAADAWYAPAVAWARESGVFTGDGLGLFRPEDVLTRQELAAVICRFARWQGRDVTPRAAAPDYADADAIAPWALESAAWCREKGLITGLTEAEFGPEGHVTRAMAAVILARYTDMI